MNDEHEGTLQQAGSGWYYVECSCYWRSRREQLGQSAVAPRAAHRDGGADEGDPPADRDRRLTVMTGDVVPVGLGVSDSAPRMVSQKCLLETGGWRDGFVASLRSLSVAREVPADCRGLAS